MGFELFNTEYEHVFQYYTRNTAARRRHVQFYYKSLAFYSAYVYRIEKYHIAAKIFNTYREACVSLHPY